MCFRIISTVLFSKRKAPDWGGCAISKDSHLWPIHPVHNLAVSIIGSLGLLFTKVWRVFFGHMLKRTDFFGIMRYNSSSMLSLQRRISRIAVEFTAKMSNFIYNTFIPKHHNEFEAGDTGMLSFCPNLYQSIRCRNNVSSKVFHLLISLQLKNNCSHIIGSRLNKFRTITFWQMYAN